jgi:hypothetical protein
MSAEKRSTKRKTSVSQDADTEDVPKDNKKIRTQISSEEENKNEVFPVTKEDPQGTADKPIRVYADGMYLSRTRQCKSYANEV